MVQDGNHRLAAAIYRGDREIAATFSGDLEDIREAFGDALATQVEAAWDACVGS